MRDDLDRPPRPDAASPAAAAEGDRDDRGDVRTDVLAAIREILIALGIDRQAVESSPGDAPLLGHGLGIDSIEAMALAVALEERFDIRIPDRELTAETFSSVDRLARLVARLTAVPGAPGERDAGAPGAG
jgi:acyl carrier protein